MGGESKGELDRLRLRAGGMGITIKTHGANRISRRRTTLIDRTTGTVLHRDIDGVADLEARLARIGRAPSKAPGRRAARRGGTFVLSVVWNAAHRAVSLVHVVWP